MSKTITQDVKIRFNADTNAAKSQIQGLYDTLTKISNVNPLSTNMTGSVSQLQEASKAAAELAIHLRNSTNVNTGKLNLKTFTNSLVKSGRTLSDFRTRLVAIGPEGTRAFQQLTQSIMVAEKPLFNMNSALKNLGTTLINSVKWQISSSVIHGLMGAAQKATGHVKALNESLNNIRIVSGQSAEAMDKFAQKANKLAKELNTTTTAYSDAALIFYQQGLNDSAVEERVNTVIKMANVTGEAAEDVSSYMTAVWNNFDDGTKSLEYYADAMAALGAATASSTKEIAAGLEKFAAIADTVGLSYEYATSALATVVAETRQSADVVGTAFKTILSRLEGLKLGENLDDGTTLNKYSAALASVGVNIKDQQGQLKDMDQILDELGNKWQNLSRDQQVALAQTVAGTRQYTQLISLMENYDTFKKNIDIASGADGTLQDQANIYAESWEAARKRVQTSAEAIYEALLDDDFFIKLNNGLSSFLDSINLLIDGMGGLKGILPVISSLLFSMFGTQIAGYIDTLSLKVQNFGIHFTNMFRSAGNKKLDIYEQQRQQAGLLYANTIDTTSGNSGKDINMGQGVRLEVVEQLKTSMGGIAEKSSQLSGIEKTIYDQKREQLDTTIKETIELGKQASILENQVKARKTLLQTSSNESKNLFNRSNPTYIKDEDRTVEVNGKKTTRKKSEIVEGLVKDAATRAGVENADKKISVKKGQDEKFSIGRNAQKNAPALADGEDLKIQTQLLKEYTDQLTETTRAQTIFKEELGGELSNNLTQMGEQQKITTDTSIEDIEKQGQVFNNMTASVDQATERISAYESSLKQSGKTFEDTLGPKAGTALKDFSISLGKVSSASKVVSKEYDAVATAKKKINSLTPGTTKYRNAEEELRDATERLKNAQIALQKETQESSDLQKAFAQAIAEGKIKSDDLAAALQAIGYKGNLNPIKEQIENMANAESQAVTKTAELKGKIEELNNTNQGGLTFTQHLTKAVGAISQLAMGINAIKSIGNIWSDEDASIGEKILSTAMALPMALSAVGAVIRIVTNANRISNAIKLAGIKGDREAIKTKLIEIGVISSESSKIWANTVARIANLLSSPWTWALAAVAIAAITAVSISMSKQTKAIEADTEAKMKNAESTNEQAEKNKELLDTYEKAKDALDESYDSKIAYRDATMDLIKAYEIENGTILLLTKQYEELDKAINKARSSELEYQASDNRSAAKAKINTFINDLSEGSTSGSKYEAEFDDDGGASDEWAVLEAVNTLNPKSLKYDPSNGDITASVDYGNPDAIVQYYNDLKAVTKYAANLDDSIVDSDIYNDMMDEISTLEEKGIGEVVSSVEAAQQADIERITINTTVPDGTEDGMSADEINSIEDYTNFVGQLETNLTEHFSKLGYDTEQIQEFVDQAIDDLISSSDKLKGFDTSVKGLEEIENSYFKDNPEGFEKFKEIYYGLTAEEQKIALGFDYGNTDAENLAQYIQDQLAEAQLILDRDTIKVNIELQKGIQTLIEEDFEGNFDQIAAQWAQAYERGLTTITVDEMLRMDKDAIASEVASWSKDLGKQNKENVFAQIQANDKEIYNKNQEIKENEKEIADKTTKDYQSNNSLGLALAMLLDTDLTDDQRSIIDPIYNSIKDLSAEELQEAIRNGEIKGYEKLVNLLAENKIRQYEATGQGKGLTNEEIQANTGNALYRIAGSSTEDFLNNQVRGVGFTGGKTNVIDSASVIGTFGNLNYKLVDDRKTVASIESNGQFADNLNLFKEIGSENAKNQEDIQIAEDEIAQRQEENIELYKELEAIRRSNNASEKERLGIESEEYADYIDNLKETSSNLKNYQRAAEEVALSQMKMNKGISNLSKNWKQYGDLVKEVNKENPEVIKAFKAVRQDVADILDLNIEKISDEFIAEHYDLVKKAAEGNAEAIEALRFEAGEDILLESNIDFSKVTDEGLKSVESLNEKLQSATKDLKIGASIDSTGALNTLQELLTYGEMTMEEMNSYLESIGFEPEIEYVTITADMAEGGYVKFADGTIQKMESGLSVGTTIPVIKKKGTVYKGTAKNTISSENKKSSSGGGGSEKKKVEDETERYHEIEREIDRLERETSKLGEAKDLAFGASKVELIDSETQALENEIEALEKLNSEIETYYAQDKANIAQFGATFDDYGNINNYDEIIANAVEQYNSGAWTEEKYEAFKKYLEQYEETLDKWYDNQDAITDKQRDILEKKMEKIELQVQLEIDLSEDSLEYLEYQLDKIEDEAFAAADAIALINEEVGTTLQKSATYQKGLADLEALAVENMANGIAVGSGGWTEDMISQAREYRSSLLEVNQELEEYRKTIEEKLTVAIDEMNEKLNEQIARFDTYGSILDHYTTILGLSGKSLKNSSLIIELGNKTVENAINKLESAKAKQDALESSLENAQKEYNDALARGDTETIKYWEDQIEKLTIQVEEGKETILATFEETLQTAADVFAAAVEQTVATLSSALSKYESLDTAADQFEKQKTLAEQFLDTNTQIYELSKLMRTINGEIAKTDNLAAKSKLRDVMEEINDIQANNTKLTKYDLDMLNAKYQLRLAEIALEESQNAKNQVRLTQTAGGGWGYVYTANQESIDKAQQNYEDKLYAMQQLSQDSINELSDSIIQNEQEMIEALGNLRAEDFEDYAAYEAELNRLTEYYLERDKFLREQFGKAIEDAGINYEDTLLYKVEPAAQNWEQAHQNVVDNVNGAVQSMINHYDKWKGKVSDAYKVAGYEEGKFRDQVIEHSNDIIKASEKTAEKLKDEAKAYSDYLTEVILAIEDFQTKYSTTMGQVITENERIVQSMNNIFKKFTNMANAAEETAKRIINAASQTAQANWGSPGGSGGGGYNGFVPNPGPGDDTTTYKYTYNINKNSKIIDSGGKKYLDIGNDTFVLLSDITEKTTFIRGNSYGGIYGTNTELQKYRWYSMSQWHGLVPFDTGGYTGAWGPEGRMAMLHEKEIVLNKTDTKNLLTSIEVVRSIASQLDMIGRYQRMSELISAYGVANGERENFEQNVHISAEFPNVVDHNEIEEAINNLINYSSQYMNRYR